MSAGSYRNSDMQLCTVSSRRQNTAHLCKKKKKKTRMTLTLKAALPTPKTPCPIPKLFTCILNESLCASPVPKQDSLDSSPFFGSVLHSVACKTSPRIDLKPSPHIVPLKTAFHQCQFLTPPASALNPSSTYPPCSLPLLSLQIKTLDELNAGFSELKLSDTPCLPLEISDYLNSMFEWEEKTFLFSNPFNAYIYQPSLTRIRRNIIFWLYELNHRHSKFQYPIEVLFLAIQYFDRFVERSFHSIETQGHFYLLGMVCLSLAAKLSSEYDDPVMYDMVYQLSPWKYTKQEVLKFQLLVLKALNYQLNDYTPLHFLHELLKMETLQEFLSSVSKEPVMLETVHEQLRGSLPTKIVQPFLKIALRYLVVSLYADPGTLPSTIALACLNESIKIRFQELQCEFLVSVVPQSKFFLSRMMNNYVGLMQQFAPLSARKEGVSPFQYK